MYSEDKIKTSDFNYFIEKLEYNYPNELNAMELKYLMLNNLDHLKKEIFDNIIALDSDKIKPYLNKLKYVLEQKKKHVWIKSDMLDKWYKKYNSVKEDEDAFTRNFNPLYEILNSAPPTFRDKQEEGYNPDTDIIQKEFYNYYYGYYVDAAISFIDEQLKDIEPQNTTIQPDKNINKEEQTHYKPINTDLSVEQLSFFLKLWFELKPENFKTKSEAEYLRWVSASYATKKSSSNGISIQKLRNLFNKPDPQAAEFWEKHLYTMLDALKKFK